MAGAGAGRIEALSPVAHRGRVFVPLVSLECNRFSTAGEVVETSEFVGKRILLKFVKAAHQQTAQVGASVFRFARGGKVFWRRDAYVVVRKGKK
jgi:hypothetical protein